MLIILIFLLLFYHFKKSCQGTKKLSNINLLPAEKYKVKYY